MKPVSPAAMDPDRFTLSITADGKPLGTDLRVIRVDVSDALNAVAKARVVLMTGTPPEVPFSTSLYRALESGRAIQILAGYQASPDVIFSGVVARHEGDLSAGTSSLVVIAEAATVTTTDPDEGRLPVLRIEYGDSIISFKAETRPGKSRLSDVRGEVTFHGSALPKPDSTIELAGLGEHFDGDMFVTAVHHDIANGQWTTRVEFRRHRDSTKPPVPIVSASIEGTDRVVTLRTAGGLIVSLNDATGEIHVADPKRNSISLATSGIKIDSASNVAITASGQIEVKAGAGLKLASSGTVTVQGVMVKIN